MKRRGSKPTRRRLDGKTRGRAARTVGLRPTAGGLAFLGGTVLMGMTAVDTDANLMLLIFGLCVGALVLNALYGWRTLRSLTVRRVVPDVAVAGQLFAIRYEVTNGRRWGAARPVHIEDPLGKAAPMPMPEAFVPLLRPGESVTLVAAVASPARGVLRFTSVRLSTRFPFHLFAKRTVHPCEQEVVVFPKIGRLAAAVGPPSGAMKTSTSSGRAGHVRGDEEYYGVREYRAGDNPRRIHWRRTAVTGQLMVREMAKPQGRKLWCIVDTRIDRGDLRSAERLEQAISAAATVICDALERGSRIGLVCSGEPLVVLPPGAGRAYRPRLLTELAIRTRNTEDRLADHIRRLSWPARWRGPCLLFSAGADGDAREAERQLTRFIGPTTVYVPGTPVFDGMFQLSHPADETLRTSDEVGERLVLADGGGR